MKVTLSVVIIALFVLSACAPTVPEQPRQDVKDQAPIAQEPAKVAEPEPSGDVEVVGQAVSDLGSSIDEDLDLSEFDSLDADLGDLENLDI